MTIQTVMTMNQSQTSYLRAAVLCLLAVQGEAARRASKASETGWCAGLRNELLEIASDCGQTPPLDHQDGAELADMLGQGTLELRLDGAAPAAAADDVFVVPVKLTVVGAESADHAAVVADTFLGRATFDLNVNPADHIQAFAIGGDDLIQMPGDLQHQGQNSLAA